VLRDDGLAKLYAPATPAFSSIATKSKFGFQAAQLGRVKDYLGTPVRRLPLSEHQKIETFSKYLENSKNFMNYAEHYI
jgi:hypothetical protein